MDIQKENNLIQEAFEVEADEVGFCLDQKWGDYENPYENTDTALAFNLFKKGWQAKAQAVLEKDAVIKKLSDQLYAQEMKTSAARVLCETACELLDGYAHQDAMVILNDLEQAMKEPAND